jgi:peptide deformylase
MEITLLPTDHPMLHEDHRLHECPPELREQIVSELLEFYHNPPWGHCVGVAAPQIGYPYNIFVANGEVFEGLHFITPVDRTSAGKVQSYEGCFSVPHKYHVVQRYHKINADGKEYEGFDAIVIQHEFDHIKGKLINDKEVP